MLFRSAKLCELDLISIVDNVITVHRDTMHLDAADPLTKRNQINWRLEAVTRLARRDDDGSDYSFMAVFTSSHPVKKMIREAFKVFVLETQRMVAAAPQKGEDEDVQAMVFDLF